MTIFGSLALSSILGSCTSLNQMGDHSPSHQITIIENDEVPIFDPFFATAALLGLELANKEFVKSKKLFDAKFQKKTLRVSLWTQRDKEAPLFIVLPGFGGDASSKVARSAAYHLWKQGFQVIMFASTTHIEAKNYILEGQMPGNVPYDNQKWLSHTQKVLEQIGFQNRKIHLLGLSWGALQVLNLSLTQDQIAASGLNVETFVALNPPLNLSYALAQLDQSIERNQKRYAPQFKLHPALIGKINAANSTQLNLAEKLNVFEKDEVEFLLAWNFRNSLRFLVQAPFNEENLNFKNYLLSPWGLGLRDKEHLLAWQQSHDMTKVDSQKWPANLLVYHSLDDYLNSKDSILDLKSVLGPKMLLYRHGGHLGYFSGSRFWGDLERSLAPLLRDAN
ncbi:alpha/beta hydrolase [bacterium]|nr:alpha/beta hydrolase [bacterium]